VIGVADEKWGEVGKAIIALKRFRGDGRVGRRHCKSKLAGFKVPKHVSSCRCCRNAAGKVEKRGCARNTEEGVNASTAGAAAVDFDRFARLTGDDNPIHCDPVFAATTHFGATVAHG